jgi:hypothetical protein
MTNTLDKLLATRPWIRFIDDEREIGNSIIVTLRDEYCFTDDPGCGVRGFDTVAEVKTMTSKTNVYKA